MIYIGVVKQGQDLVDNVNNGILKFHMFITMQIQHMALMENMDIAGIQATNKKVSGAIRTILKFHGNCATQ